MIENLTTSDLNAILERLKIENSGLRYRLQMNVGEDSGNLRLEIDKNKSLIAEIEKEIDLRIKNLKA